MVAVAATVAMAAVMVVEVAGLVVEVVENAQQMAMKLEL